MRVVQISDTHLSRTKPHFADNWPVLVDWLRAQSPDLVIHTGDVTVDGADVEGDMADCAAALREVGAPVLVVPGNHDVGEARHPHQPVGAERLARWTRHFGPDRWSRDVEGWRLIGLDSLLLGSGEPEEAEQFAFAEEAMAGAGGRRLACFMHQPLFVRDASETDSGYWAIAPEPRRRLLALFDRHGVALVGTGHVHCALIRTFGATRHVWAPSAGFVCGPRLQPEMVGERRLGAVVHEVSRDGIVSEIRYIEGLRPHVIDDVVHEVYPPRRPEGTA